MAKQRIRFLLFCVALVKISNGLENHQPSMENPPLFNYGTSLAGDLQIDNFEVSKEVPLEFNITYFGSSYDSIYISKDGIISFVDKVKYMPKVQWSEGIRNAAADRPFMAPFYHDGYDPFSLGSATYQGHMFYRTIYADKNETGINPHYSDNMELVKYLNGYVQEAVVNASKDFSAKFVAVVTWVDVTDAELGEGEDCDAHDKDNKCKSATFQAVIIADKKNTFAMFNYLKMDIPTQKTYQAGFNGGYERGWSNVIPCLGQCSLSDTDISRMDTSRLNELPNLMGSDFKGRFFLDVGGEEIMRGGCLPPNLKAGMLEAFPREVGMLGGERLEVSGKCLNASSKIYCRFGSGDDAIVTEGAMINDMKGYCPVPKMTTRGSVKLSWSSDGQNWSVLKYITVVASWMVDDLDYKDMTADSLSWFARDSSSINVRWSPDRMTSDLDAHIHVKLIGYRELESKVEFKELEHLGEARNGDGSFTFKTSDHACRSNCEDFQMGLLEVGLGKEHYRNASNRVAIRYGPMALGWYVNEELSDSMGSDWSKQMCRRWHKEDKKDTKWLEDLPKCPCNLDQALADFGRWQPFPGCDLFTNSKCTFHKGAKHCVRTVEPTDSDAGNMCCYGKDHALMFTQLTFNGGAPSKKHAWGADPYNLPGKVPTLSWMSNDVIPFVHCCYWSDRDSDLCHTYTKLRPTTECVDYEVPGLAFVRGDPHITTFDGSTYNFGGRGDFWLLDLPEISIQGRFEPRRGSWDLGSLRKTQSSKWKPNALTHLTIQGAGPVLQFHHAPENALKRRGLDVMVGDKRHFFNTRSTKWQQITGGVIINNAKSMTNNAHNNFTVITNNVGINVVAVNNLLHVTVALPPSMKKKSTDLKGMGLLGTFNGNGDNDFVSKTNILIPAGVAPDVLFQNFSMSWAVDERDSLFKLEMNANQFKDDTLYFKYEDIPHDFDTSPSDSKIYSICGEDANCKWDYRITGSEKVAVATRDADELFSYTQDSAHKVENCGLPAIGDMAILSSYNFSVGEDITVTGCLGNHNFEGEANFKCVKEKMDEAKNKNRDDYGNKMVDDQNVEYVVHWVPKPHGVCTESFNGDNSSSGDSGSNQGMIIGIVIAVIVAIILIIIIVVLVRRKKKGASREVQMSSSSDVIRKDQHSEEGADEPMMAQEKKNKPADRISSAV